MLVTKFVALATAFTAASGVSAAEPVSDTIPLHSMHNVRMPRITVTHLAPDVAPGYIFITPRPKPNQRSGPMILDSRGRVVWYHPLPKIRASVNLKPQVLHGKPVLTWSQRPPKGKPHLWTPGSYPTYHVIADQNYNIIKRIRAKGSVYRTDLHAFQITDRDTALVMGYRHLPRNLSDLGGPRHGEITDTVIQELDIDSGKVLFSWSAARHVPLSNSYLPVRPDKEYDFFHGNSIAEDLDGNLLVSSRHTSAVYKIDRRTGEIIWTLGGKHSDFEMGPGTSFYYQHDAQRLADGTLTVFDNASTAWDKRGKASQVMRLKLDEDAMTASLVGAYAHPDAQLSTAEGNGRVLPSGNVFAGWGSSSWISEYAPDGRLVFAAHMPSDWWHSYRAFKAPWSGQPDGRPAIVASRGSTTRTSVYASWNGALHVARWRVLAGDDAGAMAPIADADWKNLETRIAVKTGKALVQVQALDADGNVLGTSEAIAPK